MRESVLPPPRGPPQPTYRPLNYEKAEIRLLTLAPFSADTPTLECTLSYVPLSTAPRYVALSYHWGDPTITHDIVVDDRTVPVTVNLDAALRRLQAAKVHTVWADALCLNQADKQEKSLQVPRIGTIFRKAHEVAIWLGDESGLDEAALDHLRDGKVPKPDKDDATAVCLSKLPVFRCLLVRPYWQRVWIIQELTVASRINLYCGALQIPWREIDASCACCYGGDLANVRGRPASETARRFATLKAIRKNVLTRQPIRLLDALYYTRSSLSTDPRDKIFALLGLTFDGRHFVPEPNYMGSVADSFTDLATSLVLSGEPLDFIYLRSASRGAAEGDLPSWVTDWTDLDDPVAQRQFDYIRARSLEVAADPDLHGGGGGGEVSISGSELTVRGTLFDAVDGLGSAFTADPGDEEFKEITPCSSNTTIENVMPCPSEKEISADVFWALVWHNLSSGGIQRGEIFPGTAHKHFDRLWDFGAERQQQQLQLDELPLDIPPALTKPLCAWLAENRTFSFRGRTLESWTRLWVRHDDEGTDSLAREASRFFDAIQSRMRLLVTEKGSVGWAHPQARQGDRIARLSGCGKPVILRPANDGSGESGTCCYYRVVGDACVPGWEETSGMREGEEIRIL